MSKYSDVWDFYIPSTMIAMIDNQQVKYDACDKQYPCTYYPPENWEYLGAGYIYSINGIVQSSNPENVMHFWKHK